MTPALSAWRSIDQTVSARSHRPNRLREAGSVAERIAEIVILAEDLNQINFARHFLKRSGHNARQIRAVPVPQGKGSGEQHVRRQYATEVQYYRNRVSRRKA